MLPSLYRRFCTTPGTRARTSEARVGARRPEASRTSGTGRACTTITPTSGGGPCGGNLLLAASGDKQNGRSREYQRYS